MSKSKKLSSKSPLQTIQATARVHTMSHEMEVCAVGEVRTQEQVDIHQFVTRMMSHQI